MAKPEYGGTHFLGTGTYTALNQEAADALYSQLPKGSKGEADRLVRERGGVPELEEYADKGAAERTARTGKKRG